MLANMCFLVAKPLSTFANVECPKKYKKRCGAGGGGGGAVAGG